MPDVRPRISPALATALRTGAAMHGLPSIGTYLEAVVLPMVRADIARCVALDPSLSGDVVPVPSPAVAVPVPTRAPVPVPVPTVPGTLPDSPTPNTGNESRVSEVVNPKSCFPEPDKTVACPGAPADSKVRAVVAGEAVVALDSESNR